MIEIDNTLYILLAAQIIPSEIESGITHKTCRGKMLSAPNGHEIDVILDLTALVDNNNIIPIWWECTTMIGSETLWNDFSWSEFKPFLDKQLHNGCH